jgi:hypothetical protein
MVCCVVSDPKKQQQKNTPQHRLSKICPKDSGVLSASARGFAMNVGEAAWAPRARAPIATAL